MLSFKGIHEAFGVLDKKGRKNQARINQGLPTGHPPRIRAPQPALDFEEKITLFLNLMPLARGLIPPQNKLYR